MNPRNNTKRPRRQGGFTLVESLAALLIVAILTASVVMGVTASSSVLKEQNFSSHANELAVAVDNALTSTYRLMTTETVDGVADTPVVYFAMGASNLPLTNPVPVADANGKLYLKENLGATYKSAAALNTWPTGKLTTIDGGSAVQLLPDSAYAKGYKISISSIDTSEGIVIGYAISNDEYKATYTVAVKPTAQLSTKETTVIAPTTS